MEKVAGLRKRALDIEMDVPSERAELKARIESVAFNGCSVPVDVLVMILLHAALADRANLLNYFLVSKKAFERLQNCRELWEGLLVEMGFSGDHVEFYDPHLKGFGCGMLWALVDEIFKL